MILLVGRAEAEPDQMADLKISLDAMMRATWEETDCLSCALSVHEAEREGEPVVVTIFERWADLDAMHRHLKSPPMQVLSQRISDLAHSVDVKIYDVTNERTLSLGG